LIKNQEKYVYEGFHNTQMQNCQRIATIRIPSSQGRVKVVWGPWLKLRKGPFLIYETVFNTEKNE